MLDLGVLARVCKSEPFLQGLARMGVVLARVSTDMIELARSCMGMADPS